MREVEITWEHQEVDLARPAADSLKASSVSSVPDFDVVCPSSAADARSVESWEKYSQILPAWLSNGYGCCLLLASHTLIVSSLEAETMSLESCEKVTEQTENQWPLKVWRHWPLALSHNLTVWSLEPEARIFESWEKLREVIQEVCSVRNAEIVRRRLSKCPVFTVFITLPYTMIRYWADVIRSHQCKSTTTPTKIANHLCACRAISVREWVKQKPDASQLVSSMVGLVYGFVHFESYSSRD